MQFSGISNYFRSVDFRANFDQIKESQTVKSAAKVAAGLIGCGTVFYAAGHLLKAHPEPILFKPETTSSSQTGTVFGLVAIIAATIFAFSRPKTLEIRRASPLPMQVVQQGPFTNQVGLLSRSLLSESLLQTDGLNGSIIPEGNRGALELRSGNIGGDRIPLDPAVAASLLQQLNSVSAPSVLRFNISQGLKIPDPNSVRRVLGDTQPAVTALVSSHSDGNDEPLSDSPIIQYVSIDREELAKILRHYLATKILLPMRLTVKIRGSFDQPGLRSQLRQYTVQPWLYIWVVRQFLNNNQRDRGASSSTDLNGPERDSASEHLRLNRFFAHRGVRLVPKLDSSRGWDSGSSRGFSRAISWATSLFGGSTQEGGAESRVDEAADDGNSSFFGSLMGGSPWSSDL